MPERTCGTCQHWGSRSKAKKPSFSRICYVPLPIWAADFEAANPMGILRDASSDATHCEAYAAKEARDA